MTNQPQLAPDSGVVTIPFRTALDLWMLSDHDPSKPGFHDEAGFVATLEAAAAARGFPDLPSAYHFAGPGVEHVDDTTVRRVTVETSGDPTPQPLDVRGIDVYWHNDIPDAVEQLLDRLPGNVVEVNDQDVTVIEVVEGNGLLCQLFADDTPGLEPGPVGPRFIVPFVELRSLGFC